MASEITVTLWTDHPADRSLASDLATEAAKQVFRSSGYSAAVAGFTAREISPSDIVPVPAPPVVEPSETPVVVEPEPQPTNPDGTPIPTPIPTPASDEATELARFRLYDALYAEAPAEVQTAVHDADSLDAVATVLSDFYAPLAEFTPAPDATT